ncbi:MAG: amino acid ABC transporter permease [Rhodocyclaceae bacterium]|nr:amino acid ABC transporter permease [Rhodocyclaceae bacterium]
MSYDWNWRFLLDTVAAGEGSYLDWLLAGLGWTVALSLAAWALALALGLAVGTARTLEARWLRAPAAAWVELFRNVPLLVQFFLWFFVVPELLPRDLGLWVKQDMPAKEFVTAVLCLGFFTSARVAEQLRSGIGSLPPGQRLAALALGMRLAQAYRHVILPRALRVVLPPLTSEFMNVIKNSSVAYAIGVMELTFQARQMQEETARGLETYLAVTTLYFLCAFAANRAMAAIEARSRIPGYLG